MRSKVLLYLTGIIVVTAIIIIGISIFYTSNANKNIKNEARRRISADIQSRLTAFDHMLYLVEINLKPILESSFLSIEKELSENGISFAEYTPGELKETALRNNVEELYLIDDRGIVINTSFISDMGLELFSISEEFEEFLRSLYGKGDIVSQRVSISNTTGRINMYSYYSPAGSNFIIEVSTGIRQHLSSHYGEDIYEYLCRDFFREIVNTSEYLVDLDIASVSRISRWSLINEGQEFIRDIDFILSIEPGEEIRESENELEYIYQIMYTEGKHFSHRNPFILLMVFDFSALRSDIESYLINIVIITLLIIFIIAGVSSFLFNRHVMNRIININRGITQIEAGKYDIELSDRGRDELSSICRNINNMSKTILKREQELNTSTDACRLLQDYLSNIINSMPSAIIAIDSKENITLYNTESTKKFLKPNTDYLDKNIWDSAPLLIRYKDQLKSVREKNTSFELHREKLGDNDEETYNISIFAAADNDKLEGIVFKIDDITESERKELLLNQAQKMEIVGILSGGLAHDFNNVLGAIIGNLSFIKYKFLNEKDMTRDEVLKHMTIMEEAADRAAGIIKQLLTMSRRYDLELLIFDLNDCIRDTFNILKNSFDHDINISFFPYGSKALMKGDKHQIEQSIMNICINSYHALSIMRGDNDSDSDVKGGNIQISMDMLIASQYFCSYNPEAKEGKYWNVSVKDDGVGMDRDTQLRLFDPFFSTKDKSAGTGLGLTMVYNIIKKHSGFIDVISKIGTGTTVNIYLPVYDRHLIALEESAVMKDLEDDIGVISGKVLIIDDSEHFINTAVAMLKALGFEALSFSSVEKGLKLYREDPSETAFIMIDFHMVEEISAVLDQFESLKQDSLFLITSAFLFDKNLLQTEKGNIATIEKPYSLLSLKRAIKKLIQSK